MEAMIERLKVLPGKTGFFYKNLETGEILKWNENEKFIPASVIKLPVMMSFFTASTSRRSVVWPSMNIG
ncbi:MAG: hypothetical protein EOM45_10455 [Clostridia bacterium]|nr:hypothetical protein [Clostridia bacterium]